MNIEKISLIAECCLVVLIMCILTSHQYKIQRIYDEINKIEKIVNINNE